jgi:hypothetical protein
MNEDKKVIIETTRNLWQKVKKYLETHGTSDDMDDVEMAIEWILKKLEKQPRTGPEPTN